MAFFFYIIIGDKSLLRPGPLEQSFFPLFYFLCPLLYLPCRLHWHGVERAVYFNVIEEVWWRSFVFVMALLKRKTLSVDGLWNKQKKK